MCSYPEKITSGTNFQRSVWAYSRVSDSYPLLLACQHSLLLHGNKKPSIPVNYGPAPFKRRYRKCSGVLDSRPPIIPAPDHFRSTLMVYRQKHHCPVALSLKRLLCSRSDERQSNCRTHLVWASKVLFGAAKLSFLGGRGVISRTSQADRFLGELGGLWLMILLAGFGFALYSVGDRLQEARQHTPNWDITTLILAKVLSATNNYGSFPGSPAVLRRATDAFNG